MAKGKTKTDMAHNIQLLLAEFIATALLLFLGCMGCIAPETHYISALTFGFTVLILVQMFGHISGAHLNPAVTLVAILNGMVPLKSAPFYLLGQFAGAIVGLGGLKSLVPEEYIVQDIYDENANLTVHKSGLCTTMVHPGISAWKALVIEIIITFVLILECCSIWDKRNANKQSSIPLFFGFTIAAIAIVAGPFSGASMNTARSFAPAVLNNDWENQWIYWIGPTMGAFLAHYLYKYMFEFHDEKGLPDDYEHVGMKKLSNGNEVSVDVMK